MRLAALTFLYPFLVIAGCGGGGDSGPTGFTSISGQLTLPAAVPLRVGPDAALERKPDLGSARLAAGPPEGVIGQNGLAVFRYVADAPRTLSARVETKGGVSAVVVLHDLDRGRIATTLELERGTVYDVIVAGRGGSGAFFVRFDSAPEDAGVAELPAGYVRLGHGQAAGEIVVAPVAGVDPAALADAAQADWAGGDSRLGRLRLRGAVRGDRVRELCRLLCCCARLEAAGLVRYAEPNYLRRLAQTPNDPRLADQWALAQTRVRAAWTLATGSTQVVVGVVDSGVKAGHPEMTGRLLAGYDFVDDDADPHDPTPGLAHGTSVAGILGGATNNGLGIAAVNWNARVIPVRAFDQDGLGTSFGIAQAILFAAGLPNSSGTTAPSPASVINLSFASDAPSTTEQDACDAARAAGVLLVAATGNDGGTAQQYPAAYPSVLAVGATTKSGAHATYSNRGGWVDLSAPGGTPLDGILAAGVDASGSFTYESANGTSFAAPHVAGVAALVLSVASLNVDQLEQLLLDTAQDIGSPGYDTFTGHGIVDAYAAVLAALGASAPTLMPGEEVEVRLVLAATGKAVASVRTTEASTLVFSIQNVGTGDYFLVAGTDRDFDGDIDDPGEVAGQWADGAGGNVLRLVPGQDLTGLQISIAPR